MPVTVATATAAAVTAAKRALRGAWRQTSCAAPVARVSCRRVAVHSARNSEDQSRDLLEFIEFLSLDAPSRETMAIGCTETSAERGPALAGRGPPRVVRN